MLHFLTEHTLVHHMITVTTSRKHGHISKLIRFWIIFVTELHLCDCRHLFKFVPVRVIYCRKERCKILPIVSYFIFINTFKTDGPVTNSGQITTSCKKWSGCEKYTCIYRAAFFNRLNCLCPVLPGHWRSLSQ